MNWRLLLVNSSSVKLLPTSRARRANSSSYLAQYIVDRLPRAQLDYENISLALHTKFCGHTGKLNSKVNKSGGWLGGLLGFPTQNPTSYLQHVCLARLKRYTYLYLKTGINYLAEFRAFFAKLFIFKTKPFAAFTFSSFLP
jgi:hypothetical protein